MKFFSRILAALALAAGVASGVQAQDKLILATGDVKGGSTYAIMGQELVNMCGKGEITPFPTTGGGTTNRSLLIENKVTMAPLQADMLEFTRRNDPDKVKNIRTLINLHKEEIHFIARADVKKEGGYAFGIGAKSVTFNSLADLTGRTVGAVGGSVDSANVISKNSGLNFAVQRYNDNESLSADLLNGKLDAIVVVAGAPSAMVAKLPASFKLLPIPKDVSQKLVDSKLYTPAKLSYENLRAVGVDTVAVQAVIATRVYRSAATLDKLKAFRECFYNKLGDIQDARGTHPKWQDVDGSLKSGWQWYEF
jgi:TRAP-type uncharacterized transport system substrate-binding protein